MYDLLCMTMYDFHVWMCEWPEHRDIATDRDEACPHVQGGRQHHQGGQGLGVQDLHRLINPT